MATITTIQLQEEEVVRRAQSGDRAAFNDLYETYLPRIYEFTLGMLRSKADAEDATSETFLRAVERFGDLREPAAFRGWLYAIARNAALHIIDGRKKATPVGEFHEGAKAVDQSTAPLPEERSEQAELRQLFEVAASTLSKRDRSVFELTLRHGLNSAEVASVLHVRPAYAYILVNRLKGSVIEALEAVLLSRLDGAGCAGLEQVLDGFDGEVSPRMRKAVSRHTKSCSRCSDTKRKRASIPALLEGMAWAEPSAAFAADLTAKIDAIWNENAPGSSASDGGAFSSMAGAVVAVVVFAGALLGFGAQRSITPLEDVDLRPTARIVHEQHGAPSAEATTTRSAPREEVLPAEVVEPAEDPSVVLPSDPYVYGAPGESGSDGSSAGEQSFSNNQTGTNGSTSEGPSNGGGHGQSDDGEKGSPYQGNEE